MDTMTTSAGSSTAKKNGFLIPLLSYLGLFLLAYFLFLIFTFPYEILVKGAVSNFQQSIPSWLQPLEFEKLELDLPLGAAVKGLKVGQSSGGGPIIEADSLELNAAALKALRGKIDARWKADLYGGKMLGSYLGITEKGKVELKFVGVDLERLNQLKDLTKLDLSGKLRGSLDLDWSPKWPENKGKLFLTIEDGEARNVNLKILTTDFFFTKVEGEFTLENGTLTVEHCALEGAPSDIALEGTIRLNGMNIAASYLDLWVTFSPTPELEKQIPFQLLKPVGEGKYKGHISGSFQNPKFP